jgi:hypothetical protein
MAALGAMAFTACEGGAQQPPDSLVLGGDADLRALAAHLLPDLARRSGLELREPVRLERRTRDELIRYLRRKLDEELPEDDARATVSAYALLGLVPDTLDLRAEMLGLYTEQVAGFYEPDSTALFILDDQPREALEGLLIHELVHAVQDQSVDLSALTESGLGNDRRSAAQAAIEGHATLVMLEYLAEQMRGAPVDLALVPDFTATLRPALQAMRAQFPALADAPPVIRETLLFPYLEGAGFVQDLWRREGRKAPFDAFLPLSTEQILVRDTGDLPLLLSISVTAATVAHEDNLGRLETGIFLDTHVGAGGAELSDGWGGDRYALLDLPGGGRALAWMTVWDDAARRDRFVAALSGHLTGLPAASTLRALDVAGHPGALLKVGVPDGVGIEPGLAR